MLKKFVVFNFCGWSQPRKLNTAHTLYVTLCTSTVGTDTMDTLRSLEGERRDNTWNGLTSPSLHQLLNVDRIGSWQRGVVKSTQMINHRTSFVINYYLVGVTGIIDGSERENYRWLSSECRGSKGSCTQKAHEHKNTLYVTIHCKKKIRAFNFRGWGHPRTFFNNENFFIYGNTLANINMRIYHKNMVGFHHHNTGLTN